MEGRRHACSWKKEARLYHVWVKKRPTLSATGKTFNQADLRLWRVLIDATNDGENIREYDPPEPVAGAEIVDPRAIDMSAWIKRLRKSNRSGSKREVLNTNPRIQRRFALRVEEHFGFLRDLGVKGPRFSQEYDATLGMTFRARFASRKRRLDIELDKPHRDAPGGTSFTINAVPAADTFEGFLSTMYFGLRYPPLGNLLVDFEAAHSLDEIMQALFPLYADFFRGELRPVLTAEQWHDEYSFYSE